MMLICSMALVISCVTNPVKSEEYPKMLGTMTIQDGLYTMQIQGVPEVKMEKATAQALLKYLNELRMWGEYHRESK